MEINGDLMVGMVKCGEYFDRERDILVCIVQDVMSYKQYEYGLFPKGWFEIK